MVKIKVYLAENILEYIKPFPGECRVFHWVPQHFNRVKPIISPSAGRAGEGQDSGDA
jgi:hypothetical protein